MKVFTAWWGIELLAENDKDELILRDLLDRLPQKADFAYEQGTIETGNQPENEFVDNQEGFTITFTR